MPNKRANGEGSIRRVNKNGHDYWEARYTISKDLGNGKQEQKSKYFKTQAEARKFLSSVSVSIDEQNYFQPEKITLGAWIDLWLDEYCGDKKYLTVKNYKSICDTHIKPALGAVLLKDLKTTQIQKFYNSLAKTGKEIKSKDAKTGKVTVTYEPLSVKTIHNVHGILVKCLNTAIDVEYIKSNPATRTIIPKKASKEIKPLTDGEVNSFMAELDREEPEYRDVFRIILFCGLRESEAIGLTWDCLDYETNTIHVYRQWQERPLKDGGACFAPLKNSKTRNITASAFVMQILKDAQIRQMEERMKAGVYWQGWKNLKERETYFIFTHPDGKPIYSNTLYEHYKKIAKRIDVPDSRVHDLRHTFAVLSLQNGDDVKTVQENLGHATASFTLDVYGHVSQKMKQDSADRMQAYIESITAKEKQA